jgi:cytochrome c
MIKFFTAFAIAVLALMGVGLASAQKFGTADDAKAMLDRAVNAIKNDEATALKEINNADNKEFHDRDLYVSCFNTSDGKFTAFPSPGMIGMDVRTFAYDNDPIGQRAYDALQSIPEGTLATIDFKFSKEGKPAMKQSIETRIGHQGCGVAYYK